MYRCIAKLEIDLEGLSEFYSDVSEYETLNMYQIISAWLQDDLDGPNPEKTVFGVSEYALDWMSVLPGDISYRNLFDLESCKRGNCFESIDYLYSVLYYIFEDDNPIDDGQTIAGLENGDMNPDIKWKVQYEDSLIQPVRTAIDINMGEYASGTR